MSRPSSSAVELLKQIDRVLLFAAGVGSALFVNFLRFGRNTGLQHVEATVKAAKCALDSGDRFARQVARISCVEVVVLEREHTGCLNPNSAVALAIGECAIRVDGERGAVVVSSAAPIVI